MFKEKLSACGIEIPDYNREAMVQKTLKNPRWLHFGAGNIFRGYIAGLQDSLLEKGLWDTGIIAAETFDDEIVKTALLPYDNICVSVTLKNGGESDYRAVCSVADSLTLASRDRIAECFEASSLQIVSFTVTEKAYRVTDEKGDFLPNILPDIDLGPDGCCNNLMVLLAALCYRRYKSCKASIALLSLDNCSANGSKLRDAVLSVASQWCSMGLVGNGFIDYISDEKCVAFPWSMIDRITPAPSAGIARMLSQKGLELPIFRTRKNSTASAFVNMEECSYLVVEDSFPNGRPPLEKAGAVFTDRKTVESCESMKVYTCLNPLHTALAVLGCVMGFTSISSEMADDDLRTFIYRLAYREMLPVAVEPGVLSAEDFLRDVLSLRLPNVNIPDTPQRIAADTSQKISVRFGNALRAHIARGDADSLECIPFVLAAWCRYLVGINDSGERFDLSPDPCSEELEPLFSNLGFGLSPQKAKELTSVILSEKYLGIDASDIPLADKTAEYFLKMMKGPGAVLSAVKEINTE